MIALIQQEGTRVVRAVEEASLIDTIPLSPQPDKSVIPRRRINQKPHLIPEDALLSVRSTPLHA